MPRLRYHLILFFLLLSSVCHAGGVTFKSLNVGNDYKVAYTCSATGMKPNGFYVYLFLVDENGNYIVKTSGQQHLNYKHHNAGSDPCTVSDTFTFDPKELNLTPGKRYRVCLTASSDYRGARIANSEWKSFTYSKPQTSQPKAPAAKPQVTTRSQGKSVKIEKVWLDMSTTGRADIYTKLRVDGYKGQKLVLTYRFYDTAGKMVNVSSYGDLKAGCMSANDSYALKVVNVSSDGCTMDVCCSVPFAALEKQGLPYSPKRMDYDVRVAVEDYNMKVLAKAPNIPSFYFTSKSTTVLHPTKFYDPLGRSTTSVAQTGTTSSGSGSKSSGNSGSSAASRWSDMYLAWTASYNGAVILGEGASARTVKYKIENNKITISGYYKNNDVVLPLLKNNDGNLIFKGNDPFAGILQALLDKSKTVLVIQSFMGDMSAMTLMQKYYSTIAGRDKEIAASRSKANPGDPNMPIPNQSHYDSNSSQPSHRYQDNKTPHKESRYGYIDCHLCHGTGVCGSCGGNGHLYGSYNYGSATCPNCLGAITGQIGDYGKCSKCKGTGKVYGIK